MTDSSPTAVAAAGAKSGSVPSKRRTKDSAARKAAVSGALPKCNTNTIENLGREVPDMFCFNGKAYRDYGEVTESIFRNVTGTDGNKRLARGGVTVPFPIKLHQMLDSVEREGMSKIVSWLPHGRAFKVYDQDKFVSVIMPTYFKQSKLASFHRQLNLYGFNRITDGEDCNAYYHELFLREKMFLVDVMFRTKIKGGHKPSRKGLSKGVSFYQLPPLSESGHAIAPYSPKQRVRPLSPVDQNMFEDGPNDLELHDDCHHPALQFERPVVCATPSPSSSPARDEIPMDSSFYYTARPQPCTSALVSPNEGYMRSRRPRSEHQHQLLPPPPPRNQAAFDRFWEKPLRQAFGAPVTGYHGPPPPPPPQVPLVQRLSYPRFDDQDYESLDLLGDIPEADSPDFFLSEGIDIGSAPPPPPPPSSASQSMLYGAPSYREQNGYVDMNPYEMEAV